MTEEENPFDFLDYTRQTLPDDIDFASWMEVNQDSPELHNLEKEGEILIPNERPDEDDEDDEEVVEEDEGNDEDEDDDGLGDGEAGTPDFPPQSMPNLGILNVQRNRVPDRVGGDDVKKMFDRYTNFEYNVNIFPTDLYQQTPDSIFTDGEQGMAMRKIFSSPTGRQNIVNKDFWYYGLVMGFRIDQQGNIEGMYWKICARHEVGSSNMMMIMPVYQIIFYTPYTVQQRHGHELYAWNFGQRAIEYGRVAGKFFYPAHGRPITNSDAQPEPNDMSVELVTNAQRQNTKTIKRIIESENVREGGKLAIGFVIRDLPGSPEMLFYGGRPLYMYRQGEDTKREIHITNSYLIATRNANANWVYTMQKFDTIYPARCYEFQWVFEENDNPLSSNVFNGVNWVSRTLPNVVPLALPGLPSLSDVFNHFVTAGSEIEERFNAPVAGDIIEMIAHNTGSDKKSAYLSLRHTRGNSNKNEIIYSAVGSHRGKSLLMDVENMSASEIQSNHIFQLADPQNWDIQMSGAERYDVKLYRLPPQNANDPIQTGDMIIQISPHFIYMGPALVNANGVFRLVYSVNHDPNPNTKAYHSIRDKKDARIAHLPPGMRMNSFLAYIENANLESGTNDAVSRHLDRAERVFCRIGESDPNQPFSGFARVHTNQTIVNGNYGRVVEISQGRARTRVLRFLLRFPNQAFELSCNVIPFSGERNEGNSLIEQLNNNLGEFRELIDQLNTDVKQEGVEKFFVNYEALRGRNFDVTNQTWPPASVKNEGATIEEYIQLAYGQYRNSMATFRNQSDNASRVQRAVSALDSATRIVRAIFDLFNERTLLQWPWTEGKSNFFVAREMNRIYTNEIKQMRRRFLDLVYRSARDVQVPAATDVVINRLNVDINNFSMDYFRRRELFEERHVGNMTLDSRYEGIQRISTELGLAAYQIVPRDIQGSLLMRLQRLEEEFRVHTNGGADDWPKQTVPPMPAREDLGVLMTRLQQATRLQAASRPTFRIEVAIRPPGGNLNLPTLRVEDVSSVINPGAKRSMLRGFVFYWNEVKDTYEIQKNSITATQTFSNLPQDREMIPIMQNSQIDIVLTPLNPKGGSQQHHWTITVTQQLLGGVAVPLDIFGQLGDTPTLQRAIIQVESVGNGPMRRVRTIVVAFESEVFFERNSSNRLI